MDYDNVEEAYFYFMLNTIDYDGMQYRYFGLLKAMNDITFFNVVELDKNRISDAYNYIRRMWVNSGGEPATTLMPSVLEVLISLSIHVVEYIGDDNEYGITVQNFFWTMIKNLGWDIYDDRWISEKPGLEEDRDKTIRTEIVSFVLRKYGHDGIGGPFPIFDGEDQNQMDLWQQAMRYLVANFMEK